MTRAAAKDGLWRSEMSMARRYPLAGWPAGRRGRDKRVDDATIGRVRPVGIAWGGLRVLLSSELRRNWRSLVVLGLLMGLAGGAVIGATAAARRTSTAYDRLRAATHIDDARVMSIHGAPPSAVVGLPSVVAARTAALGVAKVSGPRVTYYAVQSLPPGRDDLFKPRVVSGRRYRDDAPDEAIVSESAAVAAGIRPGDVLRLSMLAPTEVLQFATGFGEPDGPTVELRVTGLARMPGPTVDSAPILASPAFATRYPEALAAGHLIYLRMGQGARSVPALQQALDRLSERLPRSGSPLPALQLLRADDGGTTIRATARVLTRGLIVFAAAVGAMGLISVGLGFLRYHARGAGDQRIELALGMTAAERTGARALAAGLSTAVAVLAAVGTSAMVAGIDPLGPLQRFEPDPGWSPNVAVILIGAVATGFATVGLAAVAASRAGRHGPARVAHARQWRLPGPAWLATGVRFALDGGSGQRPVPVRASLMGVSVGILGVVACSIFASSRDSLVNDRARWGWTADLAVMDVTRPVLERLERDDRLRAVTVVSMAPVRVRGREVLAYALTPVKGSVGWTLSAGRMPTGADEVTVGQRLGNRMGVRPGDSIAVQTRTGGQVLLEVVGAGLGPSLNRDHLGDNLVLSPAGIERVRQNPPDREALIGVGPGHDAVALTDELGRGLEILRPQQPPEVSNLAALGPMPTALGACLAGIALLALANVVVVTSHRRARELAVLRVIGLTPGQARRSILVMAITTTVVGATVGALLGAPAGRLIWGAVVGALGIATRPEVPLRALAGFGVALVVACTLVAVIPARRASGIRPALLLPQE